MQDRDLSNEELEQLNALDNQVHAAPDSGECDQSALYVEQDQDLSAADDEWEEGRYPFEITDLKLKKSKKAPNFFKYLELTLTCIAGQKKDRKMFDRVMIEGEKPTALARLVVLGKATDMYDLDSKKFFGRYIDLVGKGSVGRGGQEQGHLQGRVPRQDRHRVPWLLPLLQVRSAGRGRPVRRRG
jgi:hypothetical protein